jgi:hypothetical protein
MNTAKTRLKDTKENKKIIEFLRKIVRLKVILKNKRYFKKLRKTRESKRYLMKRT